MTDPYVTFDTLTIDEMLRQQAAEQSPTPGATAPVLVKIPRLAPSVSPCAGPPRTEPSSVDEPSTDEATILRVDAASMAHARQVPPTPEHEAEHEAIEAAVFAHQSESPGLLLSLQPMVAANSRWIALLVTLAVIVLSLVLLRSEAPTYQDTPPINPLSDDQAFGAHYAETDDLKSIDSQPWLDALVDSPTVAAGQTEQSGPEADGPISSPRVAAPRARLAGKVETPSPLIATTEPSSPRLLGELPEQDADAGSGYPRTANSDPAWIQPENENVIR